ncbi:MAG: glycosyl hydrolase family 18 protein [Clostridia bacterium]
MRKTKILVAVMLLIAVCATMFVGCTKLANVKVNTKGMFPEENLAYKKPTSTNDKSKASGLVDGSKSSGWTAKGLGGKYVEIDFGKEIEFNTVVLQEKTDNVNKFRLYAYKGDKWEMIYEQDRILALRTCYIEPTTASKLRLLIMESRGDVKITDMAVYNQAKRDTKFMVTDYCTMDYNEETGKNQIVELKDNPAFTGYFEVITDVIVFGSVEMDNQCNIIYTHGEENFAKSLDAMRYIIKNSGRDIKMWCTILFNSVKPFDGMDFHDTVASMVKNNSEKMHANIKAFLAKYDFYGIDMDWEYPGKASQWKMYDKLVLDLAEYTRVSVALPPWGIGFSSKAREAIHHVNLMTYDLFDARGDHCNIFIGSYASVVKTIEAGFKKEQIMMGIPTYGRVVNGSGGAWPVYNESFGEWGNIVRDYNYGEEEIIDGKKVVNRFTSDGYVNGCAMVRDKTLTAINMNVGGIMVFRAKCDAAYTYEFSLHKAMKEVIDNRIGK